MMFLEKCLNRGGILLYSKQDALDFVRACKNHEIGLLGVDGFFISETTTQPSMEDSVDYSSGLSMDNIYEKAIAFIEGKRDDLYFEIVCE